MKSLEMPYMAHIPYKVLSDKNLQPMAKIHFGCISGLAVKEGYCWATDKQFAEMHGVDESTIKRWNKELEKGGHIQKISENKPYRTQDGKMLWRKERKIYINRGFSNNSFEGLKNEPIVDRGKNEPYKEDIPKDKSKNTTIEEKVIVFSSLHKLNISDKLKEDLSKVYTQDEVDLAVSRTLAWKNRENDEVGIRTTLKKAETWQDIITKEDVEEKNRAYVREKLNHLDGKTLGPYKVTIGAKYVEFSSSSQCEPKTFTFFEKDFIPLVEQFLQKLKKTLK